MFFCVRKYSLSLFLKCWPWKYFAKTYCLIRVILKRPLAKNRSWVWWGGRHWQIRRYHSRLNPKMLRYGSSAWSHLTDSGNLSHRECDEYNLKLTLTCHCRERQMTRELWIKRFLSQLKKKDNISDSLLREFQVSRQVFSFLFYVWVDAVVINDTKILGQFQVGDSALCSP